MWWNAPVQILGTDHWEPLGGRAGFENLRCSGPQFGRKNSAQYEYLKWNSKCGYLFPRVWCSSGWILDDCFMMCYLIISCTSMWAFQNTYTFWTRFYERCWDWLKAFGGAMEEESVNLAKILGIWTWEAELLIQEMCALMQSLVSKTASQVNSDSSPCQT